jgi:isoquinoline 1-oxidoreductase beta subunit
MMSPVSRRFVLTGAALTTASLLVPISVRPSRAAESYEITDWIAIASSGEVTLALSQPEVGQGSYTALPQILADELDADWKRVTIRFVTGKPAYKIAFRQEPPAQKEGASMSTTALYARLRTAGAAARDVLVRAAAQRWAVDAGECRTEKGFVINARGCRICRATTRSASSPISSGKPSARSMRSTSSSTPVPPAISPARRSTPCWRPA